MADFDMPSHIIDHVYLGSRQHARGYDMLKQLNITHILNVTPSRDTDPISGVPNFFEKKKLFIYRRCAIFDSKSEDLVPIIESSVEFIENAKHYGRILVHCNKGISRSVSLVVAYVIKYHGLSYDEALSLVKKKRPIASPNTTFLNQLRAYARRQQHQKSQSSSGVVKESSLIGPSIQISSEKNAILIGPKLPSELDASMPQACEPRHGTSAGPSPRQEPRVHKKHKKESN
uniref:protein-tyrosine-phosphatase n=1 Tax=Albugo laibachii Nc14 TaxID=890382 RepID=F0WPI1_9STRA|nr:conserved unknown protein putative [Albugo laibachii Nc14]|eukprot:CCA23229.1 conserved unknown protein putative [Albugo laibachii Nc14]